MQIILNEGSVVPLPRVSGQVEPRAWSPSCLSAIHALHARGGSVLAMACELADEISEGRAQLDEIYLLAHFF